MGAKHNPSILLAMAALAAASLACSLGDILFPKTFHVTKTADTADGECSVDDCSLREAVIASNETDGHNTIILPPGTYVLTIHEPADYVGRADIGDLDITDGVTIGGTAEGWEASGIVIDGNADHRIFDVGRGVVRVEITDMVLTNGSANAGGALDVEFGATVSMNTVLVDGNSSQTGLARGGGIANQGTLTLDGVYVVNNRADDGGAGGIEYAGGGIYNSGTLVMNDSYLAQNLAENGGGLFNEEGTATLNRTNLASNSALYGGAIYNYGTLSLNDSFLGSNQACNGGALYNLFSTVEVLGSEFVMNTASAALGAGCGVGGAITNVGTLTLTNSTLAQNVAASAGGINSSIDLIIVNSTISDNTATTLGGGVLVGGGATITNSTISHNSAPDGAGIRGAAANIRLINTIIANNIGANCAGATFTSLGHNLEDINTCGLSAPGDRPGINPVLDALQWVNTAYLRPILGGSGAIDFADPAACPETDQRGAPRPFGPVCDIGAYEFGLPNAAPRVLPTVLIPTTTIVPTGSLAPSLTVFPTATNTLPPPSVTDTRPPSNTPPPEVFITDTPTPTSTQGLIIVTLLPFKPTLTAIP